MKQRLFLLILLSFVAEGALVAQVMPDTSILKTGPDSSLVTGSPAEVLNWQECFSHFIRKGNNQYHSGNFKAALDLYEAAAECMDLSLEMEDSIANSRERAKKSLDEELSKSKTESMLTAVTTEALAQFDVNPTMAVRLAHEAAKRGKNGNKLAIDVRAKLLNKQDNLYYLAERDLNLPCTAMDLSPNGKTALLGFENSLELGSLDLQSLAYTKITSNNAQINSLAYSPSGLEAIVMEGSDRAYIWNFVTSQREHEFTLPDTRITAVAWSRDGLNIALGTQSGLVRVFEAQGTYNSVMDINHPDAVNSIAFFPGKPIRLAVACQNFTAYIWEPYSKKSIELTGHSQRLNAVSISTDGSYLVTASNDKTAIIWTDAGSEIASLRGHEGWVTGVSIDRTSNLILTTSMDGSAKIWDKNGKYLYQIASTDNPVLRAAIFPEGDKILTNHAGNQFKIWTLPQPDEQENAPHTNGLASMTWLPDGKAFLTGGLDYQVKMWDAQSGQVLWSHQFNDEVTGLAVTPDGNQIIATLWNGFVHILSKNGQERASVKAHKSSIYSVASAADGKSFITAGRDGTAKKWSIAKLQQSYTAQLPGQVTSCAYQPNDKGFAFADALGTLVQVDKSGKETRRDSFPFGLRQIIYAPNPIANLLVVSDNKEAYLLNSGGNTIATFGRSNWASITAAAFSPSGDTIAFALSDHKIMICATNGTTLHQINSEHSGFIRQIAFSPDGNYFLTISYDGICKEWTRNGNLVNIYRGHGQPISQAYFDEQNSTTTTVSAVARTLKVWDGQKNVLLHFEAPITGSATALDVDHIHERQLIGTSNGTVLQYANQSTATRKVLTQMDTEVVGVGYLGTEMDTFIAISAKGQLKKWINDQLVAETKIAQDAQSATVSADRSKVAFLLHYDSVLIWDQRTNAFLGQKLPFQPEALAWSHDGQRLYLSALHQFLALDLQNGQSKRYVLPDQISIASINCQNPQYCMTTTRQGQAIMWDQSTDTSSRYPLMTLQLPNDSIVFAQVADSANLVLVGAKTGPVIRPCMLCRLDSDRYIISLSPEQRKRYKLDLDYNECFASANPAELRNCAAYFEQVSLERDHQLNSDKALKLYDRLILMDESPEARVEVIRFLNAYIDRLYANNGRDISTLVRLSARVVQLAEGLMVNPTYQRNILKQQKMNETSPYAEILWSAYWNHSWYLILQKKWAESYKITEKGLAVFDDNPNKQGLQSNRAIGLLFTAGKEITEQHYLHWKDKPWIDSRFATFKDAFLADLKEIETHCTPLSAFEQEKIAWVRGLLESSASKSQ